MLASVDRKVAVTPSDEVAVTSRDGVTPAGREAGVPGPAPLRPAPPPHLGPAPVCQRDLALTSRREESVALPEATGVRKPLQAPVQRRL